MRNRLALVAVMSAALAFAAAAGARSEASTVIVTYTTPTTLKASYNGSPLNGSTIPAGTYMVDVNDDPNTGDLNPNFTINGPGVAFVNNLNSTGMGIDGLSSFGPFTFQTSSSYTIEDKTLGASTAITFTTGATAGDTGGSGGQAGSVTSSGSSQRSGSGGSSSAATSLGTVLGSLSSTGRLTFVFGGKSVKSLRPGRYTVRVVDRSKKYGLVLKGAGRSITLSRVAAVGTSSHSLTLSAGRWSLSATGGDSRISFSVS